MAKPEASPSMIRAFQWDPDGNLIELQEYTSQSRQFTGEDFQES